MSQQKQTLKDLLKQRQARQAVKPVDLYLKRTVNKPVSQKKNISSTKLKKFSSYLTPESIKDMKRIALEADKKDFEVLQEAVDRYVKKNKVA